jgi:phosphoribosylformylglycinamidine cyclo-ligase
VSSTDGVGTKLKIAFMMDRHDTVGIDLVAMCVNDIAVQGAKPLFFLDYLSMGKLKSKVATEIITGIGLGCEQAKCALIGGETAEMPGFYPEGEYDLAGFSVGIVDNAKMLDGSEIRVGHKLIGIGSNGLHSNGYSLVRKPTKIYSETVQQLIKDLPIHGLAHITGGGIQDNLMRIIPRACEVEITRESWDTPPVFNFLKQAGNIEEAEMLRTFNCGIGMIAVVPSQDSQDVLERLTAINEKAFLIGEIVECRSASNQIKWI